MTTFLIIWFILGFISAVYVVGRIHAFEINVYSSLNNKPDYIVGFLTFLLPPAGLFATVVVYSPSEGWVWPKKGVTYQ